MSDFTKGEWKLSQPKSGVIEVLGYTGIVATLEWNSLMTLQEVEANAYLISAASVMYEALKALKEHCEGKGGTFFSDVQKQAFEALAKANGK